MRRSGSRFIIIALVVALVPLLMGAKNGKKSETPAKSVTAAAPNCPAEPEDMTKLFNGTDLTGWDGNPKFWSVKDGIVRGQTTAANPARGNTFLIWKAGTVADFDFRCSFKLTGGDSGVQVRSKDLNKWVVSGYQFEINNDPARAGYLYHEKSPKNRVKVLVGDKSVAGPDGVMKVVGHLGDAAAIKAAFKPKDWNDCCVVFRGNKLQLYVNGVETSELEDNDPKYFATSGILALQIHAGEPMLIEFKDVRIKQYPAATAGK